jgi:large subunit ribosomal protein L24
MASKTKLRRSRRFQKAVNQANQRKTMLRKGDVVMVIAGGNKDKRPLKGKVGKISAFASPTRAVVEGLNLHVKHKQARKQNESSGKISKEMPMHVSNLMYYVEKIKKPVRLHAKFLEDGTKVRGYRDPESKEFIQL